VSEKEFIALLRKKNTFDILSALYPNNEFHINQLADILNIDRRNMSKYLKELEKNGLVTKREEIRPEGGNPYKKHTLTDAGHRIIFTIMNIVVEKEKQKPEEWQINKIIQILKDKTLTTELRVNAAHKFFSLCQEDALFMTENLNVIKLFEEISKNPSEYIEEVSERIRASISSSFSKLINYKNRDNWVLNVLYPLLKRHLENQIIDEKYRVWALRLIGDIGRLTKNQNVKTETIDIIFKTYFSNDVDLNSKIGEQTKYELLWLSSKEMFDKIQNIAKSEDILVKNKAELLMTTMIKNFGFEKPVKIYV